MTPLSKYVLQTTKNGNKILYHTVTKQTLPLISDHTTLKQNCFLEGSEHQSIINYLTRPQQAFFTIVNTWECNLRCTHCTVTHKLLKQDTHKLNTQKTINFIENYTKANQTTQTIITFLGGEPLLDIHSISNIMSELRAAKYGITTNLALPLTNDHMILLKNLDFISVSVDGTETIHNKQRKSLQLVDNPYQTTINNLKQLVNLNLAEKITIQGAIADEYYTKEHRREFYRSLLKIGIKFDNIKFSTIHPTHKNPNITESFTQSLQNPHLYRKVCCKYRPHTLVITNDGSIYTDFYSWDKVGTIEDDPTKIYNKSIDISLNMPALRDEKCKQCKVIGYCWGGCTNGLQAAEHPSDYCNQTAIIEEVTKKALEGSLI